MGDLVEFKRDQGAKTPEERWSTVTRLIGFDGDKVAWGLCEGVPVCVSTDKIRPASPEKVLAYMYLNGVSLSDYTSARPEDQQNYVDESRSSSSRATRSTEVPDSTTRTTEPAPVESVDPEAVEEDLLEEEYDEMFDSLPETRHLEGVTSRMIDEPEELLAPKGPKLTAGESTQEMLTLSLIHI